MRTDVARATRICAGTVVGEARELATVYQPEVVLDSLLAIISVGAEPGLVSGRGFRDTLDIGVGLAGVGLGTIDGVLEEYLFEPFAGNNLIIADAGDSEVAGELNRCNILNSGVEALGGAVSIDISEQGRCLDGVSSCAGSSKVVCSRDW